MKCPFCAAGDTRVVDSRLANEGASIRRRRECLECAERFTTFESAQLVYPHVIKHDGTREPFDEKKLRRGMLRALEKRPVDINAIEAALDRIKHRLHVSGERELGSRVIGEHVMGELRDLDEVAYVRFASVYRRFQDIQAFRTEIDRLTDPRPDGVEADLARRQLVLPGTGGEGGAGERER